MIIFSEPACRPSPLMRITIIFILLVLIVSCRGKDQHQEKASNVKITEINTAQLDSLKRDPGAPRLSNDDSGHFFLQRYTITLRSTEMFPKQTIDESGKYGVNYIAILDKATGRSDTLKLGWEDDLVDNLTVINLTDSLHFNTLHFLVHWSASSDYEYNNFYSYDGRLKFLFDMPQLISIDRKDENTLIGYAASRDDIVGAFQNYPFTVSVNNNYEVKFIDQPNICICWETEAMADMHVFKTKIPDSSKMRLIKEGTHLRVDTFYTPLKMVRLILSDSTILYARPEEVKEKVRINAAG